MPKAPIPSAESVPQVKLPIASPATPVPLLDRDHSILAFNERVLDWACRPEVPVLERLRFLCIVSANLDEFFEVRAEPHLSASQARQRTGLYTQATFEALASAANKLVTHQYSIYNDQLLPAFRKRGIQIMAHGERNPAQRHWVKAYFQREVRPLLIPVGLDPAHPFPAGGQQVTEFHRPAGRQRRFRARQRYRHRQGAAGAAAVHPDAGGRFRKGAPCLSPCPA